MLNLTPGFTINGKFHLTRLLGEGGMGTIWEAEQLEVGRSVAIKVIREEMGNEQLVLRFERETLALGRLNHPNCVTLLDYGKIGETSTYFLALPSSRCYDAA